MRILYMGTPDFAVPSLEELIRKGHDLCGVFTQPDRARGRGMKESYSPVKQCALSRKIPVYQPVKMRDGTAEELIRTLSPELIVVVAYGRLLPSPILALPPLGCVNLHASLLPKYRGAAPIQRAILCGEAVTGLTTMYMAEELDTGDMILRREVPVAPEDTGGTLHDRLMEAGAGLLSETVDLIAKGRAPRTPQNHDEASFAPMIEKVDLVVRWDRSAKAVADQIRAFDPKPGANATLEDGRVLRFFGAHVLGDTGAEAGVVLSADKEGLVVACDDSAVMIGELQGQGTRRMTAGEYLRGHPVAPGARFV